MMACPAISPGSAFLSGVLDYVDCQAQVLGQNGWQALAAPGSAVSLILGGLLTIFVALFGYRLLLGHVPDLREGVVAIVRVGIVLVLATSWPAFRTLAYDVTMRAPAELAASIGGAGGLPGASGGLVARLQRIDNGLVELIELGTGNPNQTEQISPTELAPSSPPQAQTPARRFNLLRWDPAKDAEMVAQGRTLYLTGAIAGFASVRIVAGLLLALGPLFALFLLFDATRGLFESWVRGVVGAGLGALSTSIVLGLEIALLEPWLAQVLSARRADIAAPTAPVELLVMSLVFGLTLIAALIAVARVAQGFRIPDSLRAWPAQLAGSIRSGVSPAFVGNTPQPDALESRSRAYLVADAVMASQRREQSGTQVTTSMYGGRNTGIGQAMNRDNGTVAPTPLGQANRRRTSSRISAGARRRDTIS